MHRPACNISAQPVVIDDDGRTLGGQEWGAVDVDSDRVTALVEAGVLVVPDPDSISESSNVDAVAAKAEADRANRDAPPADPKAKRQGKPEPEES